MKYHIGTIFQAFLLIIYIAFIAPAQLEMRGDKAFDMVATSAVTLFIFVVVAFLIGEKLKRESEGEHDE